MFAGSRLTATVAGYITKQVFAQGELCVYIYTFLHKLKFAPYNVDTQAQNLGAKSGATPELASSNILPGLFVQVGRQQSQHFFFHQRSDYWSQPAVSRHLPFPSFLERKS